MTTPASCDCGSPFQIHMSNDPKCSKLLGTYKAPDVPNPSAIFSGQSPSSQSEIQGLSGEIQHLIAAQNRTTHSVRAFVRFLFIQLSATSAAVVLWNFASAQVDPVACAQYGEHCSPIGAL